MIVYLDTFFLTYKMSFNEEFMTKVLNFKEDNTLNLIIDPINIILIGLNQIIKNIFL